MNLVENTIPAAQIAGARGIGVDYSTKKIEIKICLHYLYCCLFHCRVETQNYRNGKPGPARERETSQAILSPHGLPSQMCL
jgi:hypothetical protein